MLPGEKLNSGQLTILSRYYDIVRYKKGEDMDFPFQNALGYCVWGANHNAERGNSSFVSIIKSYDINGYNDSYPIQLWRGGQVANGTHRVALNIYHESWEMSATVLPRKSRHDRGIEWFVNKGLDEKWVHLLKVLDKDVQTKLFEIGETFSFTTDVLPSDLLENEFSILLGKYCKHFEIYLTCTNEIIVLYALKQPNYVLHNRELWSLTADRLYKDIEGDLGISLNSKSYNCTKGRQLFDNKRIKVS